MDARRIGFAAALAIGCLVLIQGVGCGSSNDGRNGGSGDNGADAGTGNNGADAGTGGTTQGDGFTGSNCTAPQNEQQGSCQTGYICETTFPDGYCTKSCTADADCGTGNTCLNPQEGTCSGGTTPCWVATDCTGTGVTCQNAQPGACVKGCDTSVQAGACRASYECIPASTQGTAGVCFPDCRQASGLCGNDVCDQTTGQCKPAAGNAGAYQSCATDNCQAGLDPLGQAQDGSDCICYPDCTNGAACPGTDVCALQWSGGGQSGNSCLPDCTNGQACPNGWTCQDAGGGKKVCYTPPS